MQVTSTILACDIHHATKAEGFFDFPPPAPEHAQARLRGTSIARSDHLALPPHRLLTAPINERNWHFQVPQ